MCKLYRDRLIETPFRTPQISGPLTNKTKYTSLCGENNYCHFGDLPQINIRSIVIIYFILG